MLNRNSPGPGPDEPIRDEPDEPIEPDHIPDTPPSEPPPVPIKDPRPDTSPPGPLIAFTRTASVSPYQFSAGRSIRSITSTCTGARDGSSRRPSCSCNAVKRWPRIAGRIGIERQLDIPAAGQACAIDHRALNLGREKRYERRDRRRVP
ncbi:MAG TPA: hypothetical protein VFO21_26875 [Vicinamibacterales bacterium]|nr:hypothetical protein [Vicinamibacterales bacterium]